MGPPPALGAPEDEHDTGVRCGPEENSASVVVPTGVTSAENSFTVRVGGGWVVGGWRVCSHIVLIVTQM